QPLRPDPGGALPRRAGHRRPVRSPGDLLGAGQVGGQAAPVQHLGRSGAAAHQHGGRPRRGLGPVRLPQGDRAGLRLRHLGRGARMDAGLIVRDATAGDLPAITALYGLNVETGAASFETGPPPEAEMAARQAAVTGLGLPWLVAEIDGAFVGYGYAGAFRPRP